MRQLVSYLLTAFFIAIAPNIASASGSLVVKAFGETCLPERLSFEKSKTHAQAIGWKPVLDSDNSELESVITMGKAAANDPENSNWKLDYDLYSRLAHGKRLYLVETRIHAPEVVTLIGCYIYDFDASKSVEPEQVSALLKHKLAYSSLDKFGDAFVDPSKIISYVWGPPPSLPRQFDTYLSYIPENSPLVEKTGFSGVVLKSSASQPRLAETK